MNVRKKNTFFLFVCQTLVNNGRKMKVPNLLFVKFYNTIVKYLPSTVGFHKFGSYLFATKIKIKRSFLNETNKTASYNVSCFVCENS